MGHGLLAPFSASFYERDDSGEESDIGIITGWIVWSALGGDIADAAISGLVRSLTSAGFQPWQDDKAMWMLTMDE